MNQLHPRTPGTAAPEGGIPLTRSEWPRLDMCLLMLVLGMFVAALFVVPGLWLVYGLCSLTACVLVLAVCLVTGDEE